MKDTISLVGSILLAGTIACVAPSFHGSGVQASSPPSDVSKLPQVAVPKVYIIPMKGQMGTDVEPTEYEDIIADIKKVKPDIIIIQLEASDDDRTMPLGLSGAGKGPAEERGVGKIDEYRNLALKIRNELRGIPQIMWVKDAVGFSSLMAFAWPDMYMGSDARIWGLQQVTMMAMGWDDPDVAAKMMAAWTTGAKGFLELGGYPLELGDALLFPDRSLSARWEGRKVKWSNDTDGTWIIDDNPKRTPVFSAQLAEDSGLCDGTADSLDDLMFILGYREYSKIDSGEKMMESYVKSWRKSLEKCVDLLREVEGQEGGEEKDIAKALKAWESVLTQVERYPAVEYRLRAQYGISKGDILRAIETLRANLQAIRNRERGTRTGGGSGGAGLGGGGTRR